MVNIPAITRCNDCHGGREGSEAGVDAHTPGPGGRRRWFQEPGGGPIVPIAWLMLRNDHLLLELCPELKNASFETLGAKVAELGLTLDFDIAAELAQIEANKRRSSVKISARHVLRKKIHWVLGAELKARQRAEREAASSAAEVLAPSNRGRAIRAIASFAGVGAVRAHCMRVCAWQGHNWTTLAAMFGACDRTAKRLFEGAKQALGWRSAADVPQPDSRASLSEAARPFAKEFDKKAMVWELKQVAMSSPCVGML